MGAYNSHLYLFIHVHRMIHIIRKGVLTMERIITNTTSFKRTLKTVTDILTVSEMREYDLGIQIKYKDGVLKFSAEHPEHQLIVEADLKCDSEATESTGFFYLGDLSENLKKYRKKEEFFIDIHEESIQFNTEEDCVWESDNHKFEVDFSFPEESFKVSKESLVDSMNLSRAINRTTYHDSTMSMHIVLNKETLSIYATNFVCMSYVSIPMSAECKTLTEFNLPTQLFTKVRNTIARGSGKNIQLSIQGDNLYISTDTTAIKLVNNAKVNNLSFSEIVKSLKWGKDAYTFDTKVNAQIVSESYDKLRESEKVEINDDNRNEVEQSIQDDSILYIDVSEQDRSINFSKVQQERQVLVRDMYSFISKLPDNLEVAISEGVLLFNKKAEDKRVMVLIPFN